MKDETKVELQEVLEGIETEITEFSKSHVTAKTKAQVKNLIDKIDNREKLPNFEVTLTGKKGILTLSDFLKMIPLEITAENKQKIKNLNVRATGLRALLSK